MEEGSVIDSRFIDPGSLISEDKDNLLTKGSDGGVRLTASDLICDKGNCNNLVQTCEDGKLFVERPNIVSEQEGNLIVADRVDGSAMLGLNDVISGDSGNLLHKGTDGKLVASIENIVSPAKDNLIKVTDDGLIELTADDMVSDATCNILDTDKDGRLKLCLGLDYDSVSGRLMLTSDGSIVDTITVPSSASILESAELIKDPEDVGEGYYLKLVFITASDKRQTVFADMNILSDSYSGGDGISITDGRTINIKIGSDSGLTFDENGGLVLSDDVARMSDLEASKWIAYATSDDIGLVTAAADNLRDSGVVLIPIGL